MSVRRRSDRVAAGAQPPAQVPPLPIPPPPDLSCCWMTVDGEDYLVLAFPLSFSEANLDQQGPWSLTLNERLVAAAAAAGKSNQQIARARGVSTRTVANQLASVYRKLGINSRAELAARWHGVKADRSHR